MLGLEILISADFKAVVAFVVKDYLNVCFRYKMAVENRDY